MKAIALALMFLGLLAGAVVLDIYDKNGGVLFLVALVEGFLTLHYIYESTVSAEAKHTGSAYVSKGEKKDE